MALFDYAPFHSGRAVGAFPQMDWCFNPSAVSARLAIHPDYQHIKHGRIVDVYHRPGKDLDVCHAFTGPGGKELVLTLRCSTPDRGGHAFRKACKRAADPAKILQFDDHTFAWIFPDDSELSALQRFVSDCVSRTKVLSYRRGTRCTMHMSDAAEVMKFHGDAQASQQRLADLFKYPARRFSMPEPLGFDSRLGARREKFLTGMSFDAHARSEGLTATCEKLLAALADLHCLKSPGLNSFTANDMLRRYDQMFIRRLSSTDSSLLFVCQKLREVLESSIPDHCISPATLHGDMHTGNVLFDDQSAILIDLDECIVGDRAYDLSILAGELLLWAALNTETSQANLDLILAIPDIYEAASRASVNRRTFAWYLAATLASRQIKACINHCAPDFDQVATRLSRMAVAIATQRDIKAACWESIRD